MKNNTYIYTLALTFILLQLSSCILEDPMDEYEVIGAVGTISSIEVSNSSPEAGENVTFDVTFFSEHEPATSLRMSLVEGEETELLEEITFTDWNLNDSRREQFTYTVPADAAAGSSIVIEFEIETEGGFTNAETETLEIPAEEEEEGA